MDIETEISKWVDEVVDEGNVVWAVTLLILSDDYSRVVVTKVDTIDLRGKE